MCERLKPISDFCKDKSRPRGHHPYCRNCQNKVKYRNKQKVIDRATSWNKYNPIRRKKTKKRWYDKNPELVRNYGSKRRALEKSKCDGTVTKESLAVIDKKRCGMCGCDLDWNKKGAVHLDHIIPLSKGGEHSISNVQWACARCNLSKGNKIIYIV